MAVKKDMPHFIIAGHGRSGTKYMAALMKHYSYQIGWQQLGKYGTSCFHSVNFMRGCEESNGRLIYRGDENTYLIQVVRNPWKVVESDRFVAGNPSTAVVGWFPYLLGANELETSINSVVFLNERIASFKPHLVVKVEEAPVVMKAWLSEHELFKETVGETPPTNENHIDHETLTANDYAAVRTPIMNSLRAHCRIYGYEEEF